MMNPASINVSAPTYIQPIFYPVTDAGMSGFNMWSSGTQQPFVTSNIPWSGSFSATPNQWPPIQAPTPSPAPAPAMDLQTLLPMILIIKQLQDGNGGSKGDLKSLLPLLLLSGSFGGGGFSTNASSSDNSGSLMAVLMQLMLQKTTKSSQNEINRIRNEYETKIDGYEKQIENINTQHKNDIKVLLNRHKEIIAELNKTHEQEINGIKTRHARELEAAKNASEAEKKALQEKHAKELADCKAQQGQALEDLKRQHQQEINRVLNSAITALTGSINEGLDSSYFTDAELTQLTNNPQSHWNKINAAHDGKANLISNARYDLTSLRNEFPDLKNVLPAAKYSTSHPNKNYLLGEAQNSVDIVNKLRKFKEENGISTNSHIDNLINRLLQRARNYIKSTNNLGSPIALDLNGDGKIGTRSQANGIKFDLDGNGSKEQISWLDGNDGFLVQDRNNNGTIDSGKELFGDQHGASNGFEELKKFDSNNDGKINAADSAFNTLKVWQDANGDGISQAGELKTLAQVGISEISLGYSTDKRFLDENGVDHREQSTFTKADGTGLAVDVWLEIGM